ncbi:F-box/kelch-repeat protein At3g06240-like [Rosa rugosa]|uniref:F-box/kelch-repeat protein At3g06240-like n=1 Tax=Rosa rugosa TaxID=74645 RepID=UPI002B41274A|nr:F-box/kelch-repeat protein At3g06240-like [Rosa rugosa]
MWNPSTGFFRNIPCPNFQIGMINWTDEEDEIGVYYGFGQVSASDDYKLVVIPNLGVFMEVQVFSVKANCWKVVKAPYLTPYHPWSEELGTYSNGAIHWVSNREPGIFEPPVYAFDLANEEFREMPLPDAKKYTVFWVMKEYGLPESWVKLFGFNIHDLPDVFNSFFSRLFWDPIFIAEDGTVVIKLRTQRELIWIKCRKEEKPFCTDRYRLEEVPEHQYAFYAIWYDETLVSIPE